MIIIRRRVFPGVKGAATFLVINDPNDTPNDLVMMVLGSRVTRIKGKNTNIYFA